MSDDRGLRSALRKQLTPVVQAQLARIRDESGRQAFGPSYRTTIASGVEHLDLQWEPVNPAPWWRRPFLRGLDRLPAMRLTPASRRRLNDYVDAQLARRTGHTRGG